jgi:putative N6-adenine-specific DNA methylase
VAAPGFEPLVAAELQQLGVREPRVALGGVEFEATPEAVYRCNLHLRSASRVLVRRASFHAASFAELERHAGQVRWDEILPDRSRVMLRVTCHKSRLYHSDAVAERVSRAIHSRVHGVTAASASGPADPADLDAGSAQLFVVRLDRNECTISADTSGAHLHQRGYRRAVTQAPLRETLAAGLLLASGWDRASALVDPFCGSGTVCIEAAMMARRMAPGRARRFRFMEWPDFDRDLWHRVKSRAEDAELPSSPAPIHGSDRSASAMRAAIDNAGRAGVADDLTLSRGDAADIEPPAGSGWLVTNPPYGVRLREAGDLKGVYAAFGNALRARFAGWHVCLLSADHRLQARLRLPLEELGATTNGGIRVHVVAGTVETGKARPASGRSDSD